MIVALLNAKIKLNQYKKYYKILYYKPFFVKKGLIMKTKILFLIFAVSLYGFLGTPRSYAVDEIPRITIQNAIPLAEGAMVKGGIDKNKYYIFDVSYTRASLGYFWDITFKPVDPYDRNLVHVRVYMDSQTEVLDQSERRRRR